MDTHSILYTRQKIDMLHDTLAKPAVIDLLGEKYERVIDCASRLVVVSSMDDTLSSPKLRDPNTIPVISMPHLGEFSYKKGAFQFSTKQTEIVDILLDAWASKRTSQKLNDTFEQAADSLVGVWFDFRYNTEALNSCVAVTFSQDELGDFLATSRTPTTRLARVALRPALAIAPVRSHDYDTSDMIVHELIHNIQKEDSPITLFDSQQDVVDEAIRCELEAYHYGAMVRMAMEGIRSLDDYIDTDMGKNYQLDIESARQQHQQSDDAFEPNDGVVKGIATMAGTQNFYSVGLDVEAILASKAIEYNQQRVKRLPPKAKKSRGRTTRKSR